MKAQVSTSSAQSILSMRQLCHAYYELTKPRVVALIVFTAVVGMFLSIEGICGSVLAMFSGVYYWLPKWTGHMYDETLGKVHFWLTVISFNITFFPQHFLGFAGMPRRIPDYSLQFAEFNMVSRYWRVHPWFLAADSVVGGH